MPEFLAELCNSISTNGSLCQAFNFQADTNIGWFKGGASGLQIDFSKTCRSPNITTWILDAGTTCQANIACLMLCKSTAGAHLMQCE